MGTTPKDQDALRWNATPPPRVRRPGLFRWSLWKAGARIDCELRIHGEYGVEMQLLRDGELAFGRFTPTMAAAEQLAASERTLLERDGWQPRD